MILTAEDLHKIEDYLDQNHSKFESLGRSYYEAFGAERQGQVSSQVRNLQQVAISAPRFSDIEDFVKNQMGKKPAGSEKWRQVGKATLDQLGTLETQAEKLVSTPEKRLQARLRLARGWVRAVVSEYLYAKAEAEMASPPSPQKGGKK